MRVFHVGGDGAVAADVDRRRHIALLVDQRPTGHPLLRKCAEILGDQPVRDRFVDPVLGVDDVGDLGDSAGEHPRVVGHLDQGNLAREVDTAPGLTGDLAARPLRGAAGVDLGAVLVDIAGQLNGGAHLTGPVVDPHLEPGHPVAPAGAGKIVDDRLRRVLRPHERQSGLVGIGRHHEVGRPAYRRLQEDRGRSRRPYRWLARFAQVSSSIASTSKSSVAGGVLTGGEAEAFDRARSTMCVDD
jgi:hypothetical protein